MTNGEVYMNLTAPQRFAGYLSKISAAYNEENDTWDVQTDEDEGQPIFTEYTTQQLYENYFLKGKRP
jgi:hypothetical protein